MLSGVSVTLDPVPASVPAARRWARDQLALLPQYPLDVVLLCLSELATNALLHARTGLTVNLIEGDTTLRVEVVDTGDLPVAHRKYAEDRDAESGRGLQLVAVLASDYGIDINADQAGVTAWFEVGPADDAAVEIRDDVTA
ncbi:MAG: hypothetical protein QOC82_367 [Frankiaceae bacterium]|nr:hypothetical protein [Frankiaceae bacterium]